MWVLTLNKIIVESTQTIWLRKIKYGQEKVEEAGEKPIFTGNSLRPMQDSAFKPQTCESFLTF